MSLIYLPAGFELWSREKCDQAIAANSIPSHREVLPAVYR